MPSWKKLVTSGSNAVLNHVTASGNVSGSSSSTGSFGRVQASVLGGNSPLIIDADNLKLDASGTLSGSSTSVGTFGTLKTANDFIVNSNGRVGINTTSPDYKLDVAGNIGMNEYLYHNGDSDTYIQFMDDRIYINAGGDSVIDYDEDATSTLKIAGGGEADVTIGDSTTFFVGGSQGSYDAKVGIGHNAPSELLHVKKSTGDVNLVVESVAAGTSPNLHIKSPTDRIGGIKFHEGGSLKTFIFHGTDDSLNFYLNGGSDATLQLNSDKSIRMYGTAKVDSNFGIGASPIATYSSYRSLTLGGLTTLTSDSGTSAGGFFGLAHNAHTDTDNSWEYIATDEATMYQQVHGTHRFFTAGSGTAGNDVSWSEGLRIANDGKVGIGTSSPSKLLHLDASSGYAEMRLSGTSGGGTLEFYNDSTALGDVYFDTNKRFYVRTNGATTALTIDENQLATFAGTATVSGGVLTLGTADTSSGHINAFENMSFNIDTDNDDTNRFFEFSINGNSGAGTELMRLTEAGLLGIGTSSPGQKLQIDSGNIQLSSGQQLQWGGGDNAIFGHDSQNYVQIKTDSTDRVKINSSGIEVFTGNVSGSATSTGSFGHLVIGSDSTTFKNLSIDQLTTKAAITVDESAGTSNSAVLNLLADRPSDGQDAAEIRMRNNSATSFARIVGVRGSADTYGDLQFRTRNASGLTTRLAIDQDGNVGIGTTSPVAKLDVSGTVTASMFHANMSADAGSPEYSFGQDPDTGMYSGGANVLGFSTAGTVRFTLTSAAFSSQTTGGARITPTNGVAAGPAFTFNDDADTGMFRAAANQLAFSTAGSERVRIDASGRVGIGVTPSHNFNLRSSGNVEFRIQSTDDDARLQISSDNDEGQDSILEFLSNTTTRGSILYDHNTTAASQKMQFKVGDNSTTAMSILGDGNVGIGTTSPAKALHIGDASNNTGNGTIRLQGYSAGGSGNYHDIISYGDNLQFYRNTTLLLHLNYNGKVGMGTTSPTKSTHVNFSSSDTTVATGEGLAGGAAGTGLLIQNATDSTGVYANLDFRAGSADARIAVQKTNTNAGDMHFIMDNTDSPTSMMVIKNDGKVGIGTTSPARKLDVTGDIGASTNIVAGTALYSNELITRTGNTLTLKTAGGSAIATFMNTGDVGIGTVSPSAKLHVDGDAIVTGKITAQEFHTEFVSASITFESGSTKFGDTADDTHQFTGSLLQSGNSFVMEGDTDPIVRVKDTTSSIRGFIQATNADVRIGGNDNNPVKFYSNGSNNLTLAANGDVQLQERLTFSGTNNSLTTGINLHSNGYLYIAGGSSGVIIGDDAVSSRLQILNDGEHRFDVNGGEKMRLNSTGLGIGTTSPSANLHILNSSGAGHLILETTSASHGVLLDLRGSADRDAEIIFREGASAKAMIFNDASNNSLSLTDGSGGLSPVLNIKTGNVGIGTTSPAGKLQVAGDIIIAQGSKLKEPDGNAYISFDSSYHMTGSSAGDIVFDIDNNGNETNSFFRITKDNQATELMRVQEDGNVGINRTSPGYKFEVGGVILGTGGVYSYATVLAGNSTDGLPSFAMANDPDTGWRSDLSNNMRFITGGTAKMVLDSSGQLGIGTTSPNYSLEVAGNIGVNGALIHNGDGDTYIQFSTNQIGFYTGNTGNDANIQITKNLLHVSASATTYTQDILKVDNTVMNRALHLGLTGGNSSIQAKLTNGTTNKLLIQPSGSATEFGGYVTVANGDQNTPSIRFAAETDTGIARFGSDRVGFISNSTPVLATTAAGNYEVILRSTTRFGWKSDGNLSTGSPDTYFDRASAGVISTNSSISGSATSTGSFGTVEAKTFRGDGSALTGVTATSAAAGNQYNVQFNSNGSATAGSDNFVFNSSNNRVGIGTSSPTRALTISGSDFSSTSINLNRSDAGVHNDSAIVFEAESTAAAGVALGGFWFKNAVDDTTNAIFRVRTDNGAGTSGRFEFVTGTGLNNNSTPSMVIKGGGNVGIGTTSPDTKLHLADSSDVYLTLESTHASTPEEAAIKYSNSSTSANYWWAGLNQSDDYSLAYGTSFSGANTRFLVTETGNVGIGTTSPNKQLHVHEPSAGSSHAAFTNTDTGTTTEFLVGISSGEIAELWNENNTPMRFATNDTERVRIDNSGNVGIGTTSPDGRLHVHTATAGSVTANADGDDLVIENSGNAGISILTPDNRNGAIFFGDVADNNVGIIDYDHNVNELSFTVAANKALTFDANRAANFTPGNNYTFFKGYNTTAAYNLAFKDSADTWLGQIEFTPGATSQVVTRNTSNLRLGTNNTAGITILGSNQYVGIGTTSPTEELMVNGDIATAANNQFVRFNSTNSGYIGANNSGETVIRAADNSNLKLLGNSGNAKVTMVASSGNVGIGTTSPEDKLHVDGNIRATGDVIAENFIVKSTVTQMTQSFSSGSTIFGDTPADDTHQFTGSLSVTGSATITEALRLGSGGMSDVYSNNLVITSNAPAIFLDDTDVTNLRHSIVGGGNAGLEISADIHNSTTGYINFAVGGSTVARMIEGGNVGIGVTDPDSKLEVQGSDLLANFGGTNAGFYIRNNTANYISFQGYGSDGFIFKDGGNERIRFEADGKVGIGTTSPSDYDSGGNNLVIYENGNSGITIHSATTGIGAIHFADGTSGNQAYRGIVRYSHNDENLQFGVEGTNYRFKLDNSSRISLSNNDSGGTGGSDSTTGNTLFGYLTGANIASGGLNNTLFGHAASYNLTTGDNNISIGANAGWGNHTGGGNTYMGRDAGLGVQNNANSNNVGLGFRALRGITTGTENVSVGKDAMLDNTSGAGNTAVGTEALANNTSGGENVAIGKIALYTNSTTGANTAVGYTALRFNTAANNTSVGHSALYNNSSGTLNVGIGTSAGYHNQTGNYNTYLGGSAGAGASGQSHTGNTGIGYKSLFDVTTANYNTALGNLAMENITTGGTNVGIGSRALGTLTTGIYNVAIGGDAMYAVPAGEAVTGVVAIGVEAAKGDSNTTTGINYSVAIGQESLKYIRTGARNVAVGYRSLSSLTAGSNNTAVGHEALYTSVDGTSNTAIGRKALYTFEGGSDAGENTAVGALSCFGLTTGVSNVSVGKGALANGTTASANVAIGVTAMGLGTVTGVGYNVAVGQMALYDLTSGTSNVALGAEAAQNLTTGVQNVVIGRQALSTATNVSNSVIIGLYAGLDLNSSVADGSVLIGRSAGENITNGARNTAVGYQAMLDSVGAGDNAVLGYEALKEGTTSEQNVAVGSYSLGANAAAALTGNANTALGYKSQYVAQGAANSNTSVGANSLLALTTGTQNVAVGTGAAAATDDGTQITAIGAYAMGVGNAGAYNTAVGNQSLNDVTGVANVAMGFQSAFNLTSGDYNVAIGHHSMGLGVVTGNNNVAVGNGAAYDLTSGYDNVIVGKDAAVNLTSGYENVALGYATLAQSIDTVGAIAIGRYAMGAGDVANDYQIAIGHNALAELTSGDANIGIGRSALGAATSAHRNLAIGYQALDASVSGDDNIALGHSALGNLSSSGGHKNIAIGNYAGDGMGAVGNPTNNIFIGYDAGGGTWTTAVSNGNVAIGGYALDGALNGASYNVAIGEYALTNVTEADNNVAVGREAGGSVTTGQNNTLLGFEAGKNGSGDITTGQANTIIGSEASAGASGAINRTAIGRTTVAVADNSVTLGNANVTAIYAAQDRGATIYAAGLVEGSSMTLKENIGEIESPLDKLTKLRGVEFDYKSTKERSIGMIAEEVNEVFPELVNKNEDGEVTAMSYSRMTAVLLEAVKELSQEVKDSREEIRELKKLNNYSKAGDKN